MTESPGAHSTPLVGLSVMPQQAFLAATLPLFEAEQVDTIEWSFDMSWRPGLPPWLAGLIEDYAAVGRLRGHGVSLSPLSEHPRQDRWFERFEQDAHNHHFECVSEHFGFMAAGNFGLGPPMPLPMTTQTLQVGRSHLARLASAVDAPVGLENLAFAFGPSDVRTQGDFLESLLAPVDGFLVLDVHNLWCQVVNFDLDLAELLSTYPVGRVKECHVSGGSWSTVLTTNGERQVRRDTHDANVPDEVFDALETVLSCCPNVEAVIVEQIGDSVQTEVAAQSLRSDFARVRDIVTTANRPRRHANYASDAVSVSDDSEFPAEFPAELMSILYSATSPDQAITELRALDSGHDRPWNKWVDEMDPAMVATAMQLMETWGRPKTAGD